MDSSLKLHDLVEGNIFGEVGSTGRLAHYSAPAALDPPASFRGGFDRERIDSEVISVQINPHPKNAEFSFESAFSSEGVQTPKRKGSASSTEGQRWLADFRVSSPAVLLVEY